MTDDFIHFFKLEKIDINKDLSFVHHDGNELKVHIYLNDSTVFCPRCGGACCIGHGIRKRNIIHSISTCEPCHIVLYSKRFICKYCNKTFTEPNPFSLNRSQISYKTISMILDSLRSHTSTFTSVAKTYNVSIQSVINIFNTFVNCDRKALPEVLCIDEIYTKKLTHHKYSCVLLNFDSKTLVDVLPSRHKKYLIDYFSKVSDEEAKRVKYVVIDMWDSYKEVVSDYLFNPVVAVDSFHVIKHLNEAMDQIRLSIMRKFDRGRSKIENAHVNYYMLKKFHYFFKKNYDSIYDGEIKVGRIGKWEKSEILRSLLSIDEDLTNAYKLKQRYQEFNLTAEYETCDEELNEFINEFLDSKLKPFNEFGKLLKHWKKEIKNSFITINGRRLSNGCMEGANSRLKCLIKNSNGYTNFSRFRNRCMFSLNKNTPIRLYPKNKTK